LWYSGRGNIDITIFYNFLSPTKRLKGVIVALNNVEIGKCSFAFSYPSLHHLFSLAERWVSRESHAKRETLKEKIGGR
jgi:hypothetical protein